MSFTCQKLRRGKFCRTTTLISGLYPLRQTQLTPTNVTAGRGSLHDIVRLLQL